MSLFDRYLDFFISIVFAASLTAVVCMFFAGVFENAVFVTLAKGFHLLAFVTVAVAGSFLLIDTVRGWFSSREVDG